MYSVDGHHVFQQTVTKSWIRQITQEVFLHEQMNEMLVQLEKTTTTICKLQMMD